MINIPLPEGSEKLTRVKISGYRFYNTPVGLLPSVTTILSATASESSKKSLAEWIAKNPNNNASQRGDYVHNRASDLILGKEMSEPDPEHHAYFEQMEKALKHYHEPIWSEVPILKWHQKKALGEDGIGRVYYKDPETGWGWCGTPDLIAKPTASNPFTKRKSFVLADLKTSDVLYQYGFPKEDDPEVDAKRKGFFKAQKCAMQLAAYHMAAEQLLNVKIWEWHIINGTPDAYTVLRYSKFDKKIAKWLKKVEKFYTEELPKFNQPQ